MFHDSQATKFIHTCIREKKILTNNSESTVNEAFFQAAHYITIEEIRRVFGVING